MKSIARFTGRVILSYLLLGLLAFSSKAFASEKEPLLKIFNQMLREYKWETVQLESRGLKMLTAKKVFFSSGVTIKMSVLVNYNAGITTWAQLHDYANHGAKMLRSEVATLKSNRLDCFTHQIKLRGDKQLGILITMLTTKEHPQLYIEVQVPLQNSQNKIMRELAEINDILVRCAAQVGIEVANIIVFDDGMVQLQRGGAGIVFDPTQMGNGE